MFPYDTFNFKVLNAPMLTKELAGASARPIMLSLLSTGESYGYAIMQRIHDLSGGALAWSDGTLYPVLHRLEDEGLIASSWRTAENGRRRKYYRLTTKGQEALEKEKRQWLRVDAVLAQLWGLQPRLAF
ncbi:MAG TPA: helix-turn-helix transcriptional regulator [Rhodothermales bacterium]|nr:helix-turn-helix transcriptional regulator [Rhodothermales bacterium]